MAFPGARIDVILTCLHTEGIYPLRRQASTCIFLYYHATDIDTIGTQYLILSIIIVLDFPAYSLQNACEICISIVPTNESHLQLGKLTDILDVFSNLVCYNTQAMRIFQVLNFLLYPRFLKCPQNIFGKFVYPKLTVCM